MKIRILPKQIVEKIAAGEVVERPASVVKELMENSLDAQATEVAVKIGEQITDRIEVVDNGEGMNREDALVAIQSHATSKISDDTDLFTIKTLGFRGEALPSIAAVSDMEIETREKDSIFGIRLLIEAGTVRSVEETGIPKGTSVQVRKLFYTTPARRKFLRSLATEWGHIQDVFVRLSLSRQDIHFQMWRGGRQWLNAPPTEDLNQRIGQIMGWQLAEKLYPFEAHDEGYWLRGMMARPDYHNVTGRSIFFFVNRRPVRDVLLQKVLREAYHTYIPKDRFPAVFLYLDIPYDQVDVNVHPSKLEVHFSSPSRLRSILNDTILGMLKKAPWDRKTIRSVGVLDATPAIKESLSREGWKGTHDPSFSLGSSSYRDRRSGVGEHVWSGEAPSREDFKFAEKAGVSEGKKDEAQEPLWAKGQYRFSCLHVLGQLHDEFLVCESADHLVLIDQHAAHERVAFEKLRNAFCKAGIEQQALLIPSILELSVRDSEVLARHLSGLCTWGIEVEPYGRNSFAIKTMPALLSDADPSRLLRDIAEELAELDHVTCVDDLRDHVFARMACHSVVRGRTQLAVPEIQALLKEMDEVDFSLNCPHGRPVMTSWSLYEIQKRFHRT